MSPYYMHLYSLFVRRKASKQQLYAKRSEVTRDDF